MFNKKFLLKIRLKEVKMTASMSEGVGLLFIGGEGPERRILEPILITVSYSIAADSGFDLAVRLGIEPDLLVGDFDSIASSAALKNFPAARIRRYPQEKDETDAEIGLRLLWEAGCEQVIVVGGGGGRLDHLLGIVSLFERGKTPRAWYTSREHIQVVDGELTITNCRGQTVSFFPLGGGAGRMSSRGLKWPLDGLHWERGEMGISNVFIKDRSTVSVREGRILMVRTLVE